MKYLKVIFILLIAIIVYAISVKTRVPEEIESVEIEVKEDSIVNLYTMELNLENFKYVCSHYEIAHPEIVYAQAQLESGYFTSNIYKSKNNFLGLYNSKNKDYYSFSHWSDCLKGYKDYVQRKWDGNYDYYLFLQNLPYAEDPEYIQKVKFLVNKLS